MQNDSKIFIAGHRGLVGSAITEKLRLQGFDNLVIRTREELDLLDHNAVKSFFEHVKPEYVFLAAAKVGGINANNTYPAQFIYENLQIQNNIIHNSYLSGVKKLLFLGSVCIYPKFAQIPVKEESLLTGALEPTNEPYAIAKIAGIKMCQSYNRQYGTNFIAVMPTNLYGPRDNFDPQNSHVIPGLIRKMHEAKLSGASAVTLWGTGSPRREFLYVDDMAEGCLFLMRNFEPTREQNEKGDIFMNLGVGDDITIKELAQKVKAVVGYEGSIEWDSSKPDGTPKRLMDSSKIFGLGWKPNITLDRGLPEAYKWFCSNISKNV